MTTHSFFPAWATPAIALMVRNEVFIFECDAINLKTANALGVYVLISYVLSSPYVLSSLSPDVLSCYVVSSLCGELLCGELHYVLSPTMC